MEDRGVGGAGGGVDFEDRGTEDTPALRPGQTIGDADVGVALDKKQRVRGYGQWIVGWVDRKSTMKKRRRRAVRIGALRGWGGEEPKTTSQGSQLMDGWRRRHRSNTAEVEERKDDVGH